MRGFLESNGQDWDGKYNGHNVQSHPRERHRCGAAADAAHHRRHPDDRPSSPQEPAFFSGNMDLEAAGANAR